MKTVESNLLEPADRLLHDAVEDMHPHVDPFDARLTILEIVASLVGGWDVHDFWDLPSLNGSSVPSPTAWAWAEKTLSAIHESEIPAPLALASLSREVLPKSKQRKTGAYYTDWRLAQMLASESVGRVSRDGVWVDPSCGTGVLLAAAAMTMPSGPERDFVIRERLAGADLSKRALRGALISVASLTSDINAVAGFESRLLAQDSLRSPSAWESLAPNGAALVIGNPPWEKLRLSRHEIAKSKGQERFYGQEHAQPIDLAKHRRELVRYLDEVVSGTRLQGKGEHDLYKLFIELGVGLSADNGVLALLVPAGLIRSKGTESLRREIDEVSTHLSINVIENRARNFAIDSRFKFLAMVASIGEGRRSPLKLRVADRKGNLPKSHVTISRSKLRAIRPDLTVPEVRTDQEWDLFSRLTAQASYLGDPEGSWVADYRREVDMTLDKGNFERSQSRASAPVLEGRHVTQFRSRAKSYVSGEGRSAIWKAEPLSDARLNPQWHIPLKKLSEETRFRIEQSRVGFCDITGQTNERTFLVSRIPAGVVCGNKVPTLIFEQGRETEDLFIAVANSVVVDWLFRRLVTTTVNYFLLKTVPLPSIQADSKTGARIVQLSRKVQDAEGNPNVSLWEVGSWRAQIDALVADAWGLSLLDLELILADFPLIDRGQPALKGEERSTVTVDCILSTYAKHLGVPHSNETRVELARQIGAIPYIPAEYS